VVKTVADAVSETEEVTDKYTSQLCYSQKDKNIEDRKKAAVVGTECRIAVPNSLSEVSV